MEISQKSWVAHHKGTVAELEFAGSGCGWELTLDLEAPDVGDQIKQHYLA